MARLVSTEGASLIERQTAALFGDLQRLHKQMQVTNCFLSESLPCKHSLICLMYMLAGHGSQEMHTCMA